MRIITLFAVASLALAVTACGKKPDSGETTAVADTPAAANAAADASQVTSIPGYTPEGGNTAP